MIENITVKGTVTLKVTKADGSVEKYVVRNLLTTNGAIYVANKLSSGSLPTLNTMSIGTGTTAPSATDTDLAVPVSNKYFSTGPVQGTDSDSNTVIMTAEFPKGEGTGTITETGIFYGGILFARALLATAIDKQSNVGLDVTWTLQFGPCP